MQFYIHVARGLLIVTIKVKNDLQVGVIKCYPLFVSFQASRELSVTFGQYQHWNLPQTSAKVHLVRCAFVAQHALTGECYHPSTFSSLKPSVPWWLLKVGSHLFSLGKELNLQIPPSVPLLCFSFLQMLVYTSRYYMYEHRQWINANILITRVGKLLPWDESRFLLCLHKVGLECSHTHLSNCSEIRWILWMLFSK